jgi:MYND finger
MNQDEEDVGSFSIEQWLQAQDVSDRDETLDEQCAQMYILHQALASEETGQALARVIIDCDETAIDFIAEMTKSEEPRFAIMALVDLLGALGRSPEHRSRESCHRAVALKRVARAMPCVVRALCEKASSNDICGDAMSYALTLLSFLLGKAGCQERDDLQCVRSVASLEWLKVVMRIWKDPDLVGHVPGEEAPNFCRGLGYLVTLYLERVVHCPIDGTMEANELRSGVDSLIGLGQWFTAFVCMRLYAADVSEDERARLAGIIWKIAHCNLEFGAKHVFSDSHVMQAVCHSACKITCPVVSCDIELRSFDDDELQMLVTTGSGLFMHARLLHEAIWSYSKLGDTVIRCGIHAQWFWSAMLHCADVCQAIVKFNRCLVPRILFLEAPCSMSFLASVVWRACEWIAMRAYEQLSAMPNALDLPDVLALVRTVATTISKTSANPLQAQCARYLADMLIAGKPMSTGLLSKECQIGQVCEWCFDFDTHAESRLRACSRCEQVYFCDSEHLTLQWKQSHKRECMFLQREKEEALTGLVGCAALRIEHDGKLYDVARNESVGDICVREGVDVILRRYGTFVASLGGSLRIVRRSSMVMDVFYMPRGQFVRAQLKACSKEGPGREIILRAMLSTMRESIGHYVLAEVFSLPTPGQEQNLCEKSVMLFRTRYDQIPEAGSNCAARGCRSHDGSCVVDWSGVR